MHHLHRILAAGIIVALELVGVASSPAGAANDPAINAAAQNLVSALNANDVPRLNRICAPSVTVVDEFLPYQWSGSGACARWYRDFSVFAKKLGVTSFKAVRADTIYSEATPNRAYVVLAVEFRITANGKALVETGDWTLVFQKSAGEWRASALAWATRTPPHPAASPTS